MPNLKGNVKWNEFASSTSYFTFGVWCLVIVFGVTYSESNMLHKLHKLLYIKGNVISTSATCGNITVLLCLHVVCLNNINI